MREKEVSGLRRELYYQLIDVPDEKVDSFCRLLGGEGFEDACAVFANTELARILCRLYGEYRSLVNEDEAAVLTRRTVEEAWLLWKERCHQPGI